MADFGFVVFEDVKIKRKVKENKTKNLAENLFQKFIGLLFNAGFLKSRFGTRLYFSSLKNILLNGLLSYELYDDVKAWIIKLPFDPGELFHLNHDFIMEYLEHICTEKGIRDCLIPEPLHKKILQGGVFKDHCISGKVLFKSLLVPVLEDIYHRAGIRIDNLDLVIVTGIDNEEMLDIVRLLEPLIKFITIIAVDKGGIESRFSDVFSDSGLSFSISSEYRNHLKHADLIINLGKPSDILRYRMLKKSLLINLYDSVESGIPGENTVINDIVFDLAGINVKNLAYELHGYYNKTELNEIIITNKLNLSKYNKFDCNMAEYIQREFRKTGCRITGFVGRREIIGIDNVVKAINL